MTSPISLSPSSHLLFDISRSDSLSRPSRPPARVSLRRRFGLSHFAVSQLRLSFFWRRGCLGLVVWAHPPPRMSSPVRPSAASHPPPRRGRERFRVGSPTLPRFDLILSVSNHRLPQYYYYNHYFLHLLYTTLVEQPLPSFLLSYSANFTEESMCPTSPFTRSICH